MSLRSVHTTKCDGCEEEVSIEHSYENWEYYDDPVFDRGHHWDWLQLRGWSVSKYKGQCKSFCSCECERAWLAENIPKELPTFDSPKILA